jgi:uncharacterized iron-regulated protein
MRGVLAALGLLVLGCGAGTEAKAPIPSSVSAKSSGWLTHLDEQHPLVGKIWDVHASQPVDEAAVVERFAAARFVLLGERHDNPDHHRLQAKLIGDLVRAGRKPAVVLEMLEVEQQPAIDRYLATSDASAAGFGTALGWETSGWPPYAEYRPIFEVALQAGLVIAGANITRTEAKALVHQGLAALPAERVQTLGLDQTLPAPLLASLVDELRASHCGQLPEDLLEPMALAQQARDAQLALVMAARAGTDGSVLIAGGGHVRRDRGVPLHLAQQAPGAHTVTISFREVRTHDAEARAYVDDEGPFDFIWFTPRASDADPCAGMTRRKQ